MGASSDCKWWVEKTSVRILSRTLAFLGHLRLCQSPLRALAVHIDFLLSAEEQLQPPSRRTQDVKGHGATNLIDLFLCFFQQLYQILTDFDIRFYMYELLKVSVHDFNY